MRLLSWVLLLYLCLCISLVHSQEIPKSQTSEISVTWLLQKVDEATKLYKEQSTLIINLQADSQAKDDLQKDLTQAFEDYKKQAQKSITQLQNSQQQSQMILQQSTDAQLTALESYKKSEATWKDLEDKFERKIKDLEASRFWWVLWSALVSGGLGFLFGTFF